VSHQFVVKHYTEDEGPTIKGNGFDGLRVGEDREEAEEFVGYVNSAMVVRDIMRDQRDEVRAALRVADDLIKGYIEDLEAHGGSMNYGHSVRRMIAKVLA
jgi:hypothetical protein